MSYMVPKLESCPLSNIVVVRESWHLKHFHTPSPRSPSVSLAANPMESTAETSCLLGVLHHEKVWQWFEHGSSFQMVARLSLVSSAGSWGKKSGRCFLLFPNLVKMMNPT